MSKVEFFRGNSEDIVALDTNSTAQDGALYVGDGENEGFLWMGQDDGGLLPIRSNVLSTYNDATLTLSSGIELGAEEVTTAGTVGSSTNTSGNEVKVPWMTYNSLGRILESGSATHTVNNLDASTISSGTLPIERGGTGGATASAARTSLGIGDLPVFYYTSTPAESSISVKPCLVVVSGGSIYLVE